VELKCQAFGQAITDLSQQIASLPIQFNVGIQFSIPTVRSTPRMRSYCGASQRKARNQEKPVKKLWIGFRQAISMPALLGESVWAGFMEAARLTCSLYKQHKYRIDGADIENLVITILIAD
jgi:hypothetical protein